MNVAILTCTRDRLGYTKHCFGTLREFAGCDYDHYVLDQGSTDGTAEWLLEDESLDLTLLDKNAGLHRGFNILLDQLELDDYDCVMRMDNDCELTQPYTVAEICALAVDAHMLLSPRILGLNNPLAATRELDVNGEKVLDIPQIGGIFIAAPAEIYRDFRYNESRPFWGHDDVDLCAWWRSRGGTCGYVNRFEAWHYETSREQPARFPEYWARKLAEMEISA